MSIIQNISQTNIKKVKRPIKALSLAPNARDWLTNSRHPRILHIFDHACNLINERMEVLSVVTPQIGNGPFNLVVETEIFFSEILSLNSRISNSPHQLTLGELAIHTQYATLWSPRPNWEALHFIRESIPGQLTSLLITDYQPLLPDSLVASLSLALANANLPASLTAAKQLAGLGQGLTPAGDDFILGALYAAWIIHPPGNVSILAEEIANTAAPLTTSLSGAWLESAGKGAAGGLWHEFFSALISTDPEPIQNAMDKILVVGETSGADALAGFVGTFKCWTKLPDSKII